VVDVRIFSRKGTEKDERAKSIEEDDILRLQRDLEEEVRIIKEEKFRKIKELIVGSKILEDVKEAKTKEVICPAGKKLAAKHLERVKDEHLMRIKIADEDTKEKLDTIHNEANQYVRYLETRYDEGVDRVKRGDELPPGVNKLVKVYIAMKRKLQVGDKMAGRHGNKGVVAMVLPEEDMPYLPDGTPVDIILNPLGVPSRMNVGQILETHLGWAAKVLGLYAATPVFEGAKENEIKEMLRRAGIPSSGQITLHDGRTGEPFERPVTVGYMYILKLHHLVDDKIHARSIGPYSLLPSSPWEERRNSAARDWVRWRCGPSRRMVPPIPFRNS